VYFETTPDIRAAIAREKRIKGGSMAREISLIETVDPEWKDLRAGPDQIASLCSQRRDQIASLRSQ
jgi:hypothetical protein